MAHNPTLLRILQDAIQQAPARQLTFAEFMNLVLYHPKQGYYSSRDTALGPEGDFVTSAHLGNDFGELLAVQFVEMWHRLAQPNPFYLVEMGAGQGLIAEAALAYLAHQYPDVFDVLNYQIIEKSDLLRASQQKRLSPWQGKVSWTTLNDIADDSITGCFFSNELIDAFPIHLVEQTQDGLQEVYVTLKDDREPAFQEALGPLSSQRLADYFPFCGVDIRSPQYPPGYRTEVHLAALDWIKTVTAKLHQGYIVTIDYGYPAERYYGRARSQGTLQCYYQHAHHNDPYLHLGHQDITAHVNFTALERQGEICGLNTVGTTQQAMFLMALGLGDRLNALSHIQATDKDSLNTAIQRRDTLHQLISPMGLGNFIVLVQSKGVTDEGKPLRGLTVPPLF